MLSVSDVGPRRVAPPWARARLAGSRRIHVGREAHVRPDPGPAAAYVRAFPTRSIGWDSWRQLLVITDRGAPGWREFIMELLPAPQPENDEEAEALARATSHLPQLVDEGQLYIGCFAQISYPFVDKRMKERLEFLRLGSARYAAAIAQKNRAVGKTKIHRSAVDNAARLNEIRRYFPVLSGTGEKIPLVPGFNFTP